MPGSRGLNDQVSYLIVAVDAAYEKGRLAVFVLTVNVDPASDQEASHRLSVVLASDVQQGSQLGVNDVWLGPGPLKQEHKHLSVPERSRFVRHRVSHGIEQVVIRELMLL